MPVLRENVFYETCSEKHAEECEDFNNYAQLPVVNSPRMSECGYEGEVIEIERDGPF